ncbi:hypothetical protein [Vogesella sp. XCS3]|uniref:hypothetical protein n=1 Tax=Vogesella sp. XCS3 TaxID=2877939 RepID=UPI001D09C907|nr:hypothetical protein [Vogesella sp. XCS3]UDM18396.1 hypothetical protein LCH97_06985 [Vogesella sp. XCS3]
MRHDLEDFLSLYGAVDLIRTMEIIAPETEEVFITRLYKELDEIIVSLEAGKKERSEDGEDRLSIEIVSCLQRSGYVAMKDPTQGGHVDMLVQPKQRSAMKWYGEAKIWDGVAYLQSGMDQLLDRYATGRQIYLGFLVYFKEQGIVTKMKKWFEHLSLLPKTYCCKCEPITDFSFSSTHPHSSGSKILVRHFSVNVEWLSS